MELFLIVALFGAVALTLVLPAVAGLRAKVSRVSVRETARSESGRTKDT